jgi:hypothetical protein
MLGQALGQTYHPKFRCFLPNSRPLARQSSGEDSPLPGGYGPAPLNAYRIGRSQ